METPSGYTGSFSLRASYSGLEEKQSAFLLQLPLMLQFQAPIGNSAFFYLDYGMNNIHKESTNKLLEYNKANPTNYTYNSILQTSIDNKALVQEIKPFAVEIKIRIAFGGGKKNSSDRVGNERENETAQTGEKDEING